MNTMMEVNPFYEKLAPLAEKVAPTNEQYLRALEICRAMVAILEPKTDLIQELVASFWQVGTSDSLDLMISAKLVSEGVICEINFVDPLNRWLTESIFPREACQSILAATRKILEEASMKAFSALTELL